MVAESKRINKTEVKARQTLNNVENGYIYIYWEDQKETGNNKLSSSCRW